MKKTFILSMTVGLVLILTISFRPPFSDPNPPAGYTGAPTQNRTCRNCHSDFALNTAGGSIIATGLPTGSYIPGQVYPFSVTISHATAMQNWGFEIKAVVAGTGTGLGTFSTTNPNTVVSGTELKNTNGAVSTGTSYTYTNLKWTAPSTGSSLASFYIAGVAGDNDGSEAGDYVYSTSLLNVPLPLSFGDITTRLENGQAIINWNTISETGPIQFDLEKSIDGLSFITLNTIRSKGNSNTGQSYSLIDNNLQGNASKLYYRLKITDQSGLTDYSKTVILSLGNKNRIEKIYPTIVNRNEYIHINMFCNTIMPVTAAIFAASGQKILEKNFQSISGTNEWLVGTELVKSPGMYIIRISSHSFTSESKLIIK